MGDLLPCPFCGSTAYPAKNGWNWLIDCEGCKALLGMFPSEAAAIAAWNLRVPHRAKAAPSRSLAEQSMRAEAYRFGVWALAKADEAEAASKGGQHE